MDTWIGSWACWNAGSTRRSPASGRRLLLCLLGWLVGLGVVYGADEAATEVDLRKVRAEISNLQQAIRKDTRQRDSISARLQDAELTVAAARRKLEELRAERAASNQRRAHLQAERTRGEKALDAERAALAGQLRAAYTIGRQERLKLLLNQQDPAQLGRMFAYYSYFGRSRASRIDAIKAQLERLLELDQALAAENERLDGLVQRARSELDKLQQARAERTRVVEELEAQLKQRSETLVRLKRQAGTLEKLLADLRRVMADFPRGSAEPFEKLKGRLAWPVQGKLVAGFGQQRSAGLNWNGVLLATERGSKVRAVYFGRVIYADWLPGMGLLTIIEHSGGYLSLYGHNEQLYKAVGDWVAPGDVIATAGDTGGRSRPELYFEIRNGAKPLNPQQWLAKQR